MYYVVYCKDGPDNLRACYRADHLQFVVNNPRPYRFGGPLIDAAGKVVGSIMILDLPDRAALDHLMTVDPYFTHKVFSSIEIHETRQIVPEASPGTLAAELAKEMANRSR